MNGAAGPASGGGDGGGGVGVTPYGQSAPSS